MSNDAVGAVCCGAGAIALTVAVVAGLATIIPLSVQAARYKARINQEIFNASITGVPCNPMLLQSLYGKARLCSGLAAGAALFTLFIGTVPGECCCLSAKMAFSDS